MKSFIIILWTAFILFAALSQLSLADGFKQGQWKITMVSKLVNVPPDVASAMLKMRKEMDNMTPEQKSDMEHMRQQLGVSSMSINDQGQSITVSKCLKKPLGYLITPQQEQYCQQTHETAGHSVNFHMTCKNDIWQAQYSGNITYAGDTMQGQMESHVVQGGRAMDATVVINGNYDGPCLATASGQ